MGACEVGVHRVVWNNGNGLASSSLLAAGTASGLCRVDVLWGRWFNATGVATFEKVEPAARTSLSSQDVFLVDHSYDATHPAIFIWIGTAASLNESFLFNMLSIICTTNNVRHPSLLLSVLLHLS